ncbi:MAG TPA: hypothetical protein PK961_04005 [bacterium]|nr:hypothetical protein [bacterium]
MEKEDSRLNLFFDENFGQRIPEALKLTDKDAEIDSTFHRGWSGKRDEEWIQELADEKSDWIILTADWRISRKKGLTDIWKQCNLTTFIFIGGWCHAKSWDRFANTVKIWKKIQNKADNFPKGTVFKVYLTPGQGKIIVWDDV